MIKIKDADNFFPELFTLPGFVKDDVNFDLELANTFFSYNHDSRLTIFVEREPGIQDSFDYLESKLKNRPNYIVAVTAWSEEQNWPFETFRFLSNILITHRVNKNLKRFAIEQKSYNAAVLLGGHLPERERIFKLIRQYNLLDSCLVNLKPRKNELRPSRSYDEHYQSLAIKDLDDPRFLQKAYRGDELYTMVPIDNTQNSHEWLSQIIPYRLFNSAYLNIVSETYNYALPSTFYISEKISKPLILGQPFMVFGCVNYLKKLQEIGFRTFGDWIDESYDAVQDPLKRIDKMLLSFKEFSSRSTKDKLQFLSDSQYICDHNRKLATDEKWLLGPLITVIKDRLNT